MARYGTEAGDEGVIEGSAIELAAVGTAPVGRTRAAVQRHRGGGAVVKRAAAATTAGLAVGAASVALARVVREAARPIPGLARRRKRDIESSQSILIDIHVLKGRK